MQVDESRALEVLTGAVRGGTSILFAALGETISERAGVVNLGTEGSMLVRCPGRLRRHRRDRQPLDRRRSPARVAGGAAGARCTRYFVLARGSNQLATGLVVLFLGLGLTSLFGAAYVQARRRPLHAVWTSRCLVEHPVDRRRSSSTRTRSTYLSYVARARCCGGCCFRSRWGLLLRAAGERREVLTTYGHPAMRIQYIAVIVGGHVRRHRRRPAVDRLHQRLVREHDPGPGLHRRRRGDLRRPAAVQGAAGAYLFGAALALSPALQARGYAINQFALDAMPYVVTLVVLVILGRTPGRTRRPRASRRSSSIAPDRPERSPPSTRSVDQHSPDHRPHPTTNP